MKKKWGGNLWYEVTFLLYILLSTPFALFLSVLCVKYALALSRS